MLAYTLKCGYPQRPKEDIRYPGIGVTGGSKLSNMGTLHRLCVRGLSDLNH